MVQAYAYLKRLGYTVQRAPRFIPDYFDPPRLHPMQEALPPFRSWWFSLPRWLGSLISAMSRRIANVAYNIAKVGMYLSLTWHRQPFKGTLLSNWHGSDHGQSTFEQISKLLVDIQDRSSRA
jgi:tRNA-splicing endonuclease subunit Sen54